MEKAVARNSGMVVARARRARSSTSTASASTVDDDEYRPAQVRGPERAHVPEPEARSSARARRSRPARHRRRRATHNGELALGKNLLVAFMTWDGYNYEDAILVSERLVKDDVFTSIHIEEFEIEIRETKLGKRGVHARHPERLREGAANLDEAASCASAPSSKPGDILVGKVAPKSKSELTPEEKLLHAIFGAPART
jgi:DNA-directed RNA polymerase subunit beta